MLTCYGALSRNRTVGLRLGKVGACANRLLPQPFVFISKHPAQGETLAAILASSREVAEGVATTPAARALARKHNVYTPSAARRGCVTAVLTHSPVCSCRCAVRQWSTPWTTCSGAP